MQSPGLWRLSSSLTYADAAGLVFGICLLLSPLAIRPGSSTAVITSSASTSPDFRPRGAGDVHSLAVAFGCWLASPPAAMEPSPCHSSRGLALGVARHLLLPGQPPGFCGWPRYSVSALALAPFPFPFRASRSSGATQSPSSGSSFSSLPCRAPSALRFLVHHEIGLRGPSSPSNEEDELGPVGERACADQLQAPFAAIGAWLVSLTSMCCCRWVVDPFRGRRPLQIAPAGAVGTWWRGGWWRGGRGAVWPGADVGGASAADQQAGWRHAPWRP